MKFAMRLRTHSLARVGAVLVPTFETIRCIKEIQESLKDAHIALWTATAGWTEEFKCAKDKTKSPHDALVAFEKQPKDSVGIFVNLMPFVAHPNGLLRDPILVQKIRDVIHRNPEDHKMCIFIQTAPLLVEELKREIIVLPFSLPSVDELYGHARSILQYAEGVEQENRSDEAAWTAARAAVGLTAHEAEDCFGLSIAEKSKIDADLIWERKRSLIKQSGALDLYPPEPMDRVGGLTPLKAYLELRRAAYTEEGKQAGLPTPKGILLVGIQGCGKSLVAKAIAHTLGLPLIHFNVGAIFGSFLGQSENNMGQVLEILSSIGRHVLWVDEIEKAFAGIQSSGRSDSGVTARVIGRFLEWLQERAEGRAESYVVATSNRFDALPPEMTRRGRFDDLFFVDLPSQVEREEIAKVHLSKRAIVVNEAMLSTMSANSAGHTGSEIEVAIESAMLAVYHDHRNPRTEMRPADLLKALTEFSPFSSTCSEEVRKLQSWAEGRCRRANTTDKATPEKAHVRAVMAASQN